MDKWKSITIQPLSPSSSSSSSTSSTSSIPSPVLPERSRSEVCSPPIKNFYPFPKREATIKFQQKT